MERVEKTPDAESIKQEDTKMLGAHVDVKLYWAFKRAAASRGEQLKEAVAHAARMYIDAAPREEGE